MNLLFNIIFFIIIYLKLFRKECITIGINYYNSKLDDFGFTHSIDMVYCEYYSRVSVDEILNICRNIHMLYPELKYQEYLDRKPHSKYDYYLDNIVIGGAHLDIGKYKNYDKLTKSFDLFNMFQLRVNPNKYMHEDWFKRFLSDLLSVGSSGVLRKYDYAVDIPLEPAYVNVLNSRKEPGLYKGTRYYGQSGRHGYLKVYNKQKDMERQNIKIENALTRVEHTLFTGKPLSLEDIAVFNPNTLKTDYTALNDTDKAIVDMYMLLKANKIPYTLNIGRRKMEKLKEYILGEYVLLKYDLLDLLLANIKSVFDCTDSIAQDNEFLQVDDYEELPFV